MSEDENPSSSNDVTTRTTSQNHDVTGLNSRTQSYTSLASSQASAQSRLPDYDFDEDDRPGKYKSEKTDKKKKEPKKSDKKAKIEKATKKSKAKEKQTAKIKAKNENKKSQKGDGEGARKPKKNEKKSKAKKDKNKSESKEREEFISELSSVVVSHAEENVIEEDTGSICDDGIASQSDIGMTTQSDMGMTSRESSMTRKPKNKKSKKKSKKKKKKNSKSRGRKESKKKQGKKETISRASSEGSFGKYSEDLSDYVSDVTSAISDDQGYSDVTTEDEGSKKRKKKNKKNTKSPKKKKTKRGEDGPTVITVDEEEEEGRKRKSIFGIIPVPSKNEPFLYSCCLCCSLGAGSLLTGVIFVILNIAYLAIRGKEMAIRNLRGIWVGYHLLQDVWRVLLVFGMLTAAICLLGSFILIVATCLWGQKEHYKRLRKCILFWILTACMAEFINIAEAVYVQAMPVVDMIKEHSHSSDNIKSIKENSQTYWILVGSYTVLFIYLVLVVISYLRLLKYMDLPKIGTAPKPVPLNSSSAPAERPGAMKIQPKPRTRSNASLTPSGTSIQTVSETDSQPKPRKRIQVAEPTIPDRKEKYKLKSRSLPRDDDLEERVYENTCFDGDSSAPISRATSSLSLDFLNLPPMKKQTYKELVDDITNDPNVFENMSKPRPPQRRPLGRPKVTQSSTVPGEEIYVNCAFDGSTSDIRSTTPKPTYAKVSKPLKRANSLSDVRQPVYDDPPPEIDLSELLMKGPSRKEMDEFDLSSKDTGINSLSATTSSASSHPEIGEMEKLAERLMKEQEALDKAGNCDPALAENLTQMALNALRLSEKILQEVKSNEKAQKRESIADSSATEVTKTDEEKAPNAQLASKFFDRLSKDPNAISGDPIEEMFRMYGKDLCSQNPEMVNRYLMSYKTLQDGKSRQHLNYRPQSNISETVINEQKPWRSILNPSEAVPAMSPIQSMHQFPQSHMTPLPNGQYPPGPMNHATSQSSMSGPYPHPFPEDPRQSLISPTHQAPPPMSQPFHTVSHAQHGPPPPNNFFPIEYPQQNSASYKPEAPAFVAPQNSMVPYKPPPQYDQRALTYPQKWGQKYPPKSYHSDSMYYDDECPYSCCYTMYDEYGAPYGDYGPYPYSYSESMYGETGMYTGPNWFPMGDPAYSLDPYYNPYEMWDEPAPPYTERSSSGSSRRPKNGSRGYDSRTGSSSRGNDSKSGSGSRGYDSKSESRGYDSKTGSSKYGKRSRSLPNLLDDDLYSEGRSSILGRRSKMSQWGIDNGNLKDVIGRSSSRLLNSKPLTRSSSFNDVKETKEAYLRGYKAAIKEALLNLSSRNEESFTRKNASVDNQENHFIEKLISQSSRRNRSRSDDVDRTFAREQRFPRTISSDSRLIDHDLRGRGSRNDNSGHTSRNRSRASGITSRASGVTSRGSAHTEVLSSAFSRRASKLSFRPPSRPGQLILDDPYDDYRSTSSIPPNRNDIEDFGMSRKSSQSSVGFRNRSGSRASIHSDGDDILSTFELMSTHGGRPSTRSRMSSRPSSRGVKEPMRSPNSVQSSDMTYPFSEDNFYNTLDLDHKSVDMAYPDKHIRKSGDFPKNSGRNSAPIEGDRTRNERFDRKNEKSVLWFMGEDEKEPIYSSEYGSLQPGASAASTNIRGLRRTSSYPYQDTSQQRDRLESFGSSRRKVTFGTNLRGSQDRSRRKSFN